MGIAIKFFSLKKIKLWFCFLTFFLFSACSYKVAGYEKHSALKLSVPYVQGDFHGFLTEELIRSLGNSAKFSFDVSSSNKLIVAFLEEKNDKLGYRYDRELDGSLKKNLLPIESRQIAKLKVEIFSKTEQKSLYGPFEMDEELDFDYVQEDSLRDLSFINSSGVRQTVLNFSLGQLESIGAAQEAAKRALYRKIAKRIIELLDAKYDLEALEN